MHVTTEVIKTITFNADDVENLLDDFVTLIKLYDNLNKDPNFYDSFPALSELRVLLID